MEDKVEGKYKLTPTMDKPVEMTDTKIVNVTTVVGMITESMTTEVGTTTVDRLIHNKEADIITGITIER